jgi:hypothetical protein
MKWMCIASNGTAAIYCFTVNGMPERSSLYASLALLKQNFSIDYCKQGTPSYIRTAALDPTAFNQASQFVKKFRDIV